jgi:hypothetical protein
MKQKLLIDNIHFWLLFSRILKASNKKGRNTEKERKKEKQRNYLIGKQMFHT